MSTRTRKISQPMVADCLFGKEVANYPVLLYALEAITTGMGCDLREELSKEGDDEIVSKIVLASVANPNYAEEWLDIWRESFKKDSALKNEVPGYILGLVLGIFKAANWSQCSNPDFHKLMPEIIKDIILCRSETVLRIDNFLYDRIRAPYRQDLSKEIKDYIRNCFMRESLDRESFRRNLLAALSDLSDCLVDKDGLPMIKNDPPLLLSHLGALVFEQVRYALFAQLSPLYQTRAIIRASQILL